MAYAFSHDEHSSAHTFLSNAPSPTSYLEYNEAYGFPLPPKTWSNGNHATADLEKLPPVPPIPADFEHEARKTRSLSRYSLRSQFSNAGSTRPLVPRLARDAKKTVSMSTSILGLYKGTSRAQAKQKGPSNEDLHWQAAPYNPQNWSLGIKWLNTFVLALVAFVCLFASSSLLPTSGFTSAFHLSTVASTFPIAFYVLGLAFGPAIGSLASALFGRKFVLLFFFLHFSLLVLVTGLMQAPGAVIFTRFFAGFFAGPCLGIAFPTMSEMWSRDERGGPTAMYATVAFLGLSCGPVIGACAEAGESWRWTQYVVLIIAAPISLLALALRETHRYTIVRRRQKERVQFLPSKEHWAVAFWDPMWALISQPAVLLCTVAAGLVYAFCFTAVAAFPGAFALVHDMDLVGQGVSFVAMIFGVALAFICIILYEGFIYYPRLSKWSLERSAEVERSITSKRHHRRGSSKTSAATHQGHRRSTVSVSSRPQLHSRTSSRTSLALSIKRAVNGATSDVVTPADSEKNIRLALAAAEHLNRDPANEGKSILPERVLMLLNKNLTFIEICEELESYGLKVDRVSMATTLLSPGPDTRGSVGFALATPDTYPQRPQTARSRSEPADLTALPSNPPHYPTPPLPGALASSHPSVNSVPTPPPEWRLFPAAIGGLFVLGSLFFFAWTATDLVPSIVPTIAMGMLAFGAVPCLLATEQYVAETLEAQSTQLHGESAVAAYFVACNIFAAVFVLAAGPMYTSLDPQLATSVLGFLALAAAVVPWAHVLAGEKIRSWGSH